MPIKGNQMIPNAHFHKDWQRWAKTWFNQPARKKRRAQKRQKKALKVAPRPVEGPLRPRIRCPTVRYNMRSRYGKGFTLDELKAAGINRRAALTIGIAVDFRRKNRSVEGLQANVQRLKEYKSKLILFPRNAKKPGKNDATEEELKMATQLKGPILPLKKPSKRIRARPITDADRKPAVFSLMRKELISGKLHGLRQKKAREAEEEKK